MMFNEHEQVKLLKQYKIKPFVGSLAPFNQIAFNPDLKQKFNMSLPNPYDFDFLHSVFKANIPRKIDKH